MADGTNTPLQRFYRGLGRRSIAADDAAASVALDRGLVRALSEFVNAATPSLEADALETTPPRRVAVALALAVFSQPHLVNTFREADRGDALIVTNEVLEIGLGLSGWELDDLRDEVDRRAGTVLKQATLVNWLTTRYPTEQLVPLLVPGVSLANPVVRVIGGHLYIEADEPCHPNSSLHLPWLQSESNVRFRGRYADSRVKLGMARGIGVSELEAVELLERSVAVVPREAIEDRLAHDAWRRTGIAALTKLSPSYCGLDWLTKSVEPADVRWRDWVPDEGEGSPHDSMGAFDALVKIRVHHTLQALYTDLMAYRMRQLERGTDEIDVYDLSRHLRAVLTPLLAWTQNSGSATWLAEILKQDPESTSLLLDTLHANWSQRMEHWTAPLVEELPDSPFYAWLGSVGAFDGVLSATLAKPSDPRFDHALIAPLFAAHFIVETPMSRGLMTNQPHPSAPGQAMAKWFWPTWMRLLDAIDAHTARTNPEFVVPEGMF